MKKWLAFGIAFIFLFNMPHVLPTQSNFSISTDDGLLINFDENGSITDIIVDGMNVATKSSQPFWIRDLTPDYEINNLIYNGGFEIDENGDGRADGWEEIAISGNKNISLDTENVHSGNFSLKMFSYATSKKPNEMGYVSSAIPIEGGEYCLSLFAMNDFGFLGPWVLSMHAYCIFYDGIGNEISREEIKIDHTLHSWKQFSRIFVSPSNAVKARVAIIFTGPKINAIPGANKSTAWFDDICFYKMPEKTKMMAAEGVMLKNGNKLIYTGSLNDLNFTAIYESKGKYIQIDGEIEGNGREKAIDVYFLLPVYAHEWIWWNDIRNWREIDNGIYEMVINADESSYLPLSPYPLAAITGNNVGLSIAIPLSKPRIFRIFYDANSNKFGISFNFGLSPLMKFHSVNFTIYLYKCDAEWGFRSALDRYYKFFPEYFNENIDLEFLNSTGEFVDFGVRFIQGNFEIENQAKLLPDFNRKNVYVTEYTLPTQFEPRSLQGIYEPSPNYTEWLELIDYYSKNGMAPIKLKAMGAKNSSMLDTNGDIILGQIARGPDWAPDNWVGKFPLNTDPDLPELSIAKAMFKIMQIAFENAEKYNGRIDGVEIDNFMKMCRYIDMNESRFQYADSPLVYNPNNFKPGIHGMASMIEYLKYLSKWLNENQPGAKITGNCIEMGVASFGFPYLAALPFEMASLKRWNFNDVELNYRRSMAYHRYISAHQCSKMYDENGNIIMPYVYEFINESLFYGIYPIMKKDFFENCDYEVARPIYKKIIPIIDELYIAGWEPITHAKATNGIWIERFGNGSIVYFTVRNNESISKEYTITIDAEKIGIEKDASILEMLSLSNISYEYKGKEIVVHDSIDAKETKVFKISSLPMLSIEIIKPKENWLYILNRAFMPVGDIPQNE